MKRFFQSKQLVTIIAIIVCFVVLFFAYRYRVNTAIRAVSVPMAAEDLPARTMIDEKSFVTKKVANSMLTKNVIRDTNELVGKAGDTTYPAKYVNYNTFIPKGSMFYRSAVVTWDKMPDSAWADVSEDYSLISLKVNSNTTYGNSIFPGDKIDLYYQNVNEEGKVFVGPLITGITVLAVKDVNGNHIFKRSAEQKDAAALIFAVKNDEFLFLKAAFYVSGSNVIPVPRNINYNPEMDSVIGKNDEYIYNFISKRIKISTEG